MGTKSSLNNRMMTTELRTTPCQSAAFLTDQESDPYQYFAKRYHVRRDYGSATEATAIVHSGAVYLDL